MNKNARTDFPIHPFIEKRWSPRSFEANPVSSEQLRSLFEAARWAPSAHNSQPWRFLVASQREHPQTYKKILGCLDETNQAWAVRAPVLAISFAKTTLENGDENVHAWHDVGQAVAFLTLQATQFGLSVHQIMGIPTSVVAETFEIPDGYDVVSGLAIGFVGNPKMLSEAMEKKERAPRERTTQNDFVFGDGWDKPFRG